MSNNDVIRLIVDSARVMGTACSMYSQCPKCGYLTLHIMDCYGFQEIKECDECGSKYVVKYKKGREFLKDLEEQS